MKYTPKQIEKYQRQKYITTLEKITKNLFKIFRDDNSTQKELTEKFTRLKKELDKLEKVLLNSEYHIGMKNYIDKVDSELKSEFIFEEIRQPNMTQLNRLQKLKNQTSYKRDKHKNIENEWRKEF
ncbi:MAG: hypothetical protein IE878_01765 [Epsilonproteobacteria bacterium]|nr:hypothetical protein [Campylobacterota bacterium]MBD3839097.1 hypothetical protein [Campylobacterota bacterium]